MLKTKQTNKPRRRIPEKGTPMGQEVQALAPARPPADMTPSGHLPSLGLELLQNQTDPAGSPRAKFLWSRTFPISPTKFSWIIITYKSSLVDAVFIAS